MHEVAIVEALIEEVDKQLALAGCRGRVMKLRVRVGRFSGVCVEALRFAFELARQGTAMEEAELEIEQPAGVCLCEACGQRSYVEQMPYGCPICGSPQIQLQGGQELLLESIEVDWPEDANELPPGAGEEA